MGRRLEESLERVRDDIRNQQEGMERDLQNLREGMERMEENSTGVRDVVRNLREGLCSGMALYKLLKSDFIISLRPTVFASSRNQNFHTANMLRR